MRVLRDWLQHWINPAHVYCRLCDLGVSTQRAMWLEVRYENWVYRRVF